MADKELFNKTKNIIMEIVLTIDNIFSNLYNKSLYQKQYLKDIEMGLVKIKSLYVPLSSVSHKILFEEYNTVFIKSFLSFYKNLFFNINNIFIEFSFRTLISEIEIAQILFSNKIKKEEKEKFVLLLILIDYGILAFRHSDYFEDLKKLFKEKSCLIKIEEKNIFNEIIESINIKDENRHDKALGKAIKINSSLQKELFDKTKTADFLDIKKINYIYSWYSHLLHGNVFLTDDLFEEDNNPYQHKSTAHYILLVAGCNFLYQIQNQIAIEDIKLKINKILEEFKNIEPDINNLWKKYF